MLVRSLLLLTLLAACQSEDEKREAAWHREFDSLANRYQALPSGSPELPPEKVKQRKVLILPRLYGSDGPAVDEAQRAGDVGIVVTWSVQSDTVPSRTYEQGIKGYGGQVQLMAWAHPEGKRLAALGWHCNPPTTIMRMKSLQSGVADSYAEHCSPSSRSVREFAAALAAGQAPEGSNASDEITKTFNAIAAGYAPKLAKLPPLQPADVRGKKILLYFADDGAAPALYHNEYLLPAAAYANSAAEVGVFGIVRATHEARPSMHYSNGAEGYEGTAEVLLFAHPSGQLLARTQVPCRLASDDIVVNVLMVTRPQHCSGEGAAIRAAIEQRLGPLGPLTK